MQPILGEKIYVLTQGWTVKYSMFITSITRNKRFYYTANLLYFLITFWFYYKKYITFFLKWSYYFSTICLIISGSSGARYHFVEKNCKQLFRQKYRIAKWIAFLIYYNFLPILLRNVTIRKSYKSLIKFKKSSIE